MSEFVLTVIDFMKQFSVYGISLWFIVRTSIFLYIVVFPLIGVFLRVYLASDD